MKQRFRWLFVLLAVCMVITMLPIQALAAQQTFTDKYGTWTYQEESDGSITIVSFQSVMTRKNITVPASIDGKPVRKLGDGLFQNRSDLASIAVPYGVTTIGKDVFSGCDRLELVTLPQSLTAIGDNAFSNCTSLRKVFIPSTVTTFGKDLFVDSPKLEVRCDAQSPAADYLKKNAKDVNSFTLIEVTAPQPATPPNNNGSAATPATPPAGGSQEKPIQGKLVSYQFGQNINGKREFTVMLIDTMPDLDLTQYLQIFSDGCNAMLDPKVHDLMAQRFYLVSVTQWDGKASTDIPADTRTALSSDVIIDSEYDGDRWIFHVGYQLAPTTDPEQYPNGSLSQMEFSADNKLLSYLVDKSTGSSSTVKIDSKTYYDYSAAQGRGEMHYADGTLIWSDNYKLANAHKIAIGGVCVEASVSHDDQSDSQSQCKEITSLAPDRTGTSAFLEKAAFNPSTNNGIAKINTFVTRKTAAGSTTAEISKEIRFRSGDELAAIRYRALTPEKNGTYHYVGADYSDLVEWTNTFQSDNGKKKTVAQSNLDVVEYRDVVVRANSYDDSQQKVLGSMFTNEPDIHRDYVTSKLYHAFPDSHVESTTTDLATGQEAKETQNFQSLEMEHHTYIRDTGMFVGWDWHWFSSQSYTPDNPTATQDYKAYRVTEYQYDSATESWTKTQVEVTARNPASANLDDFKNQYFQGNLNDYNLSTTQWKFDPTIASGADNWLLITPEKSPDSAAIIKGESTVTDANGEKIQQADAKEEMLDIGKEMEDSLKKDDLEQIFEDTVDKIPDGADVLDKAQDLFVTQTPPESNTDDQVDHIHNDDGSVTTTITPAESASQAEETQEKAPKADAPAAETPKTDAPTAEVMETENN